MVTAQLIPIRHHTSVEKCAFMFISLHSSLCSGVVQELPEQLQYFVE